MAPRRAVRVGYTAFVMLSSDAPGPPAYATPPEVLQEVFYESLNFFYVNIGTPLRVHVRVHEAAREGGDALS